VLSIRRRETNTMMVVHVSVFFCKHSATESDELCVVLLVKRGSPMCVFVVVVTADGFAMYR
jgi:hypothetical protein